MPPAPDNTVILGKSYFVTMNSFPRSEEPPCYDLILQYDDYDLETAGLPKNLEPTDLHVCHENWIPVYKLWEAYMLDLQAAVDLITGSLDVTAKNIASFEKSFQMDLELLAIWRRSSVICETLG